MFKSIRTWWLKHQAQQDNELDNLHKQVKVLKSEVESVGKENVGLLFKIGQAALKWEKEREEAKEDARTGIACIKAVMERGIAYYDPSGLPYAEQVAYKSRARDALNNPTLQNELQHLKADWIEFCAEAPDFRGVRDMQMCINAVELVLKRLEAVPDPREPREESDNFSAV